MTEALGEIVGVLLAGGLSRRMGGGDKNLNSVGGKSILYRVIARISGQVDGLVLNANGDPDRFAQYGLPVVADTVPDFAGPLAGVLAGMRWAIEHRPEATHILTVPTDAPFLPENLVSAMVEPIVNGDADIACASSAGRSNPVCALWPIRLADELEAAMIEEGIRKVDIWTARYRLTTVDFPCDPVDPFFNANRPDDLAEAERLLSVHSDL